MAIREVVSYQDEFIRRKSKPVKSFDENLWELLDDMHETLEFKQGAGLSAVQVGVLKRVFIININNMQIEFVNPEILMKKGNQCNKEGCLSVEGQFGYVNRPEQVRVKAFDRFGNKFELLCEEWVAICVCHEYDHLDGILYIDKLVPAPKGAEEDF